MQIKLASLSLLAISLIISSSVDAMTLPGRRNTINSSFKGNTRKESVKMERRRGLNNGAQPIPQGNQQAAEEDDLYSVREYSGPLPYSVAERLLGSQVPILDD